MEQAGPEVVRLFEGKDPEHSEITFLGPTNHSIRRYMLDNEIERISDMDPEECKYLILQCVLDGKIYRDDVPRGKYDDCLLYTSCFGRITLGYVIMPLVS